MSITQTLDQAISQLHALRDQARAKPKRVNLDNKIKAKEEAKARVLTEVTSLKQEVERLRADVVAERQARQDIIDKAREDMSGLNAEHRAKLGHRDWIASAIADLKGRMQ
jgi:hypothetical protein